MSSKEWSHEVNGQGVLNRAVTQAVHALDPCHIHSIPVQAVWGALRTPPGTRGAEPEVLPSSLHSKDLPEHPAVLNNK